LLQFSSWLLHNSVSGAAVAALLGSSVAFSPAAISETFAPMQQAPISFMRQAPLTVSAVYEVLQHLLGELVEAPLIQDGRF
jgi:hypothetical protein